MGTKLATKAKLLDAEERVLMVVGCLSEAKHGDY
jgi:hypothetical protein